jgi:hypothetical protein
MRALVVLALLLVQDFDFEVLVKQLEDESIRVREFAAAALVKQGSKVEEKLKARIASATPELKVRLESVLKDIVRARVIPPLKRVNLDAKDELLGKVLEKFEGQAGWNVRGSANYSEYRVTVRVVDATPLEALNAICTSAGIDFELGSGGYLDMDKGFVASPLPVIELQGPCLQRAPQTFTGHYRVLAEHVTLNRWTRFKSQGSGGTLGIRVQWTPHFLPDQILIQITSVVDDQGRRLHEPKSWMKHVYKKLRRGEEGSDSKFATWELIFPDSDAKRIGSVKGKGWVHALTDLKFLEFEDAEKCVGNVVDYDGISARLKEFRREGDLLIVSLETWGARRTPAPLIAGGAGIRSVGEIELQGKGEPFPARSGTLRDIYERIDGQVFPKKLFRIEQADQGRSIKGIRIFVGATVIEDTFEFELKDVPLPK